MAPAIAGPRTGAGFAAWKTATGLQQIVDAHERPQDGAKTAHESGYGKRNAPEVAENSRFQQCDNVCYVKQWEGGQPFGGSIACKLYNLDIITPDVGQCLHGLGGIVR